MFKSRFLKTSAPSKSKNLFVDFYIGSNVDEFNSNLLQQLPKVLPGTYVIDDPRLEGSDTYGVILAFEPIDVSGYVEWGDDEPDEWEPPLNKYTEVRWDWRDLGEGIDSLILGLERLGYRAKYMSKDDLVRIHLKPSQVNTPEGIMGLSDDQLIERVNTKSKGNQ